MKARSPIIKVLVVSCFLVLITGFVAYRSGVFTSAESVNPMEGEKPLVDTPPPSNPILMNSSKSGKIVEPKNTNSDSILKSTEIMSSSKSGIVLDDEITQGLFTKKDSSKVSKKDTIKQKKETPKIIMSSSKSAEIFVPKRDTGKKNPK